MADFIKSRSPRSTVWFGYIDRHSGPLTTTPDPKYAYDDSSIPMPYPNPVSPPSDLAGSGEATAALFSGLLLIGSVVTALCLISKRLQKEF